MLVLRKTSVTNGAITLDMNSPFAWPGGKQLLKKRLLTLIPEHDAYVEPFCGSAKLLFAKEPSRWEVVNDLNGDVVNFFRVVRHRASELAERLEHECVAAQRFKQLRKCQRRGDEIDQALRFIYLAWWSFGAKGDNFATFRPQSGSRPKAVKRPLSVVRELLTKTAARLGDVLIDHRDFAECLERYDTPSTFFYCDPPYVEFGKIGRYASMPKEKHELLLDRLASIKGKFLLSYDDHDLVRELVRKHKLNSKRVPVSYTLNGSRAKHVHELLVSNYDFSAAGTSAALMKGSR